VVRRLGPWVAPLGAVSAALGAVPSRWARSRRAGRGPVALGAVPSRWARSGRS